MIATWQFYLSTATGEDLSGLRVRSDGSADPLWPQAIGGPPITRASGDQYLTHIVPDGTGGAYIVWDDRRDVIANGVDVYLQHVLADGQIAPGWPIDGMPVSVEPGRQERAALLEDGLGGVYVVWDSDSTVMAQHLESSGTPRPGWPAEGIRLLEIPGLGSYGAARIGAVVTNGQEVFVAWGDNRRGLGWELYIQKLAETGEVATGWPINGLRVVDASPNQQERIAIRMNSDAAGGLYLAWSATNSPIDLDDDIYATHVLADGTVAPGWPATGLPVAVQPRWQLLSGAAPDGFGGLLLSWQDSRNPPARAYVQRLRSDGTPAPGWQPQGTPISDLPGYHSRPGIAPDGDGGAFIAFEEGFNGHGYAQRVLADATRPLGWPSTGLPLVDPAVPGNQQQDHAITPDGEGGAVVVWNDFRNGISNQLYAQRYTGDAVTEALTSLVRVEALPDRVTLVWSRGTDAPAEVRVERRGGSGAWSVIERAAFAGSGSLEYSDATVTAGERYAYRLAWTGTAGERTTAETLVQVPLAIALALHGFRPNPAQGELHVAFSLPRAGATTIEVLDLGGRIVRRRDVSHLGTGNHVLRLTDGERMNPGVYWLRLRHEGRTLTAKGMVLR
ncbi:MAG: T9SS type A sorting domain-containing protein [Candidatus Eisenbacteria bacterium]